MIYLILTYDAGLRKVDRILKGICCALTLAACYTMAVGSGASMNPFFGLAESIYMVAPLDPGQPDQKDL